MTNHFETWANVNSTRVKIAPRSIRTGIDVSSQRNHVKKRSGFTLVELMVAMIGAVILIGGLSTSLMLAIRAHDTESTIADKILAGNEALTVVCLDIQEADAIIARNTNMLHIRVPDRFGGDGVADEIMFHRDTSPKGTGLYRTINGGTPELIVDDVNSFQNFIRGQSALYSEYMEIRIQVGSDSASHVQTTVHLIKQP